MHLSALDTPALWIDLDILEKNISTLQQRCDRLGIDLRVHTKTHKTPQIAHMQTRAGASGICCQKLGEAEVMVEAGLEDVFILYNIVGPAKLKRLTGLIREDKAIITVAADSVPVVEGLSRQAARDGCTIRTIVEMDTGLGRCGTQSPRATLELARLIDGLPGLEFGGVMLYPSKEEARPFLDEVRDLTSRAGLPLAVVSGGGTGDEEVSKSLGCSETRIGSYAYEGMTRIRERGDLHPDRCSLRLAVTVVSANRTGAIIVDAGQKALNNFPPLPYGYCLEHPEIRIDRMYVEHAEVNVSRSSHTFAVGEVLSFIPLHGGMTTNLHDRLHAVRRGEVMDTWEIAGRGRGR
jgi:D-serine deaminase-like pyridoxal phosphate-dependent protein